MHIFLSFIIIMFLTGCSTTEPQINLPRKDCVNSKNIFCSDRSSDYESGPIYCPKRYWIKHNFTEEQKKSINLSRLGYLYALAAVKALHINNTQEGVDHNFGDDDRLRYKPDYDIDDPAGLQAITFEEYDDSKQKLKNIVIAFRGSETRQIFKDWILQDFLYEIQNKPAREYVIKIVRKYREKYPDIKAVVTGFSLGGGLAANISRHDDTSNLVRSAWLFNPSPRDGIWWTKPQNNNFLIYEKGEFLSSPRKWINTLYNSSFAPADQTGSLDFIDANLFVDHYRWGLMLQILHAADVSYWCNSGGNLKTSPPLDIISNGHMASCEINNYDYEKEVYEILKSRKNPFSICQNVK